MTIRRNHQFCSNTSTMNTLGENHVRSTSVLKKYPTFRDDRLNGCWKWLMGRRADDNAEGLWRIHDKLYNLKEFKKKHPGGREWLTLTEGTDITEAFESYHIRNIASNVLPKYFVREASESRNYKFTFKDDGFYRTLKSRAAKKLPSLDKTSLWKSKMIFDVNFLLLLVTAVLTIRSATSSNKFLWGSLAALFMGWLNTLSHNFIHQRNNWRMYAANLTYTGWRDWRVYHGLSHHLYPNTFADYEMSSFEPHLSWIPIQTKIKRSGFMTFLTSIFIYSILFHAIFFTRWFGYIYAKRQRIIWDEAIPLLIPFTMFMFGNLPFNWTNFKDIFMTWNYIIAGGSFFYSLVAFNAGHHITANVHEGDELKSYDYGIYQLSATIDRKEAGANLFITLTHFGEHMLHHMFPSLDHSLLPKLREVFIETCRDFEEEIRECSMWEALVGQFEQLKRTETIKHQKQIRSCTDKK